MWPVKPNLKREKSGVSGTFEKLQKSLSSLQRWNIRIRRESIGIEKIFWRMRAERNPVRG